MEVNKSKSNTKDMAARPACCNVSAATVKTFSLHVFFFHNISLEFLGLLLQCENCLASSGWLAGWLGWLTGWQQPSSRGAVSHPGGTSFAAAIAHSAVVSALWRSTVEQSLSLSLCLCLCLSMCFCFIYFVVVVVRIFHLFVARLVHCLGPASSCFSFFQKVFCILPAYPSISFASLPCFRFACCFLFLFFFFGLLVPILTFCFWLSQPVISSTFALI